MNDFYPDEFLVNYEVKDKEYLFNLKWEDNQLFFKQISKNNLDIQEFLHPTPDEWDDFWYHMDEIKIWDWYEIYQVTCADSCVEGDEWDVMIEWGDWMVKSHGSNSYPSTFREFVVSLEELTGILIELIHRFNFS